MNQLMYFAIGFFTLSWICMLTILLRLVFNKTSDFILKLTVIFFTLSCMCGATYMFGKLT